MLIKSTLINSYAAEGKRLRASEFSCTGGVHNEIYVETDRISGRRPDIWTNIRPGRKLNFTSGRIFKTKTVLQVSGAV